MKRLTGRQALAAWPEEFAVAEPTDDHLQRLCALLDAIDRWVVQRWGDAGHDERLAAFADCRRDARRANQLVGTTLQRAKASRAASGQAASRRRKGRASDSERLQGRTPTDARASATEAPIEALAGS
jgi:hypothetical protein